MKKSTWRARPRGDTQCSVCISVCVPLACRVEARVEQNTITGDSAPLRVLPARERRSNAVCYRTVYTGESCVTECPLHRDVCLTSCLSFLCRSVS